MKIVQVCAAIHNFIVEQQNPDDRIRDENALLEQRNLRLGNVENENEIENDIVHDGTMATNDYLLQKYNAYFQDVLESSRNIILIIFYSPSN